MSLYRASLTLRPTFTRNNFNARVDRDNKTQRSRPSRIGLRSTIKRAGSSRLYFSHDFMSTYRVAVSFFDHSDLVEVLDSQAFRPGITTTRSGNINLDNRVLMELAFKIQVTKRNRIQSHPAQRPRRYHDARDADSIHITPRRSRGRLNHNKNLYASASTIGLTSKSNTSSRRTIEAHKAPFHT